MFLANSLIKVGLFSLGSLSLVILLDSPASAIKLNAIPVGFGENNAGDNGIQFEIIEEVNGMFKGTGIFPKPEDVKPLTDSTFKYVKNGMYQPSYKFRWQIKVTNNRLDKFKLSALTFKVCSGRDCLSQVYPANPSIPSITINRGESKINPITAGSTTQLFNFEDFKANLRPVGDKHYLFMLKEIHVEATRHDPAPAPVPGPLPLLGAAAAFSYSRKLRRSLKLKVDDAGSQKL